MKKNDFLELIITDTDKNGYGIAHAENGMTVFVRNACAGDKLTAKIIKIMINVATNSWSKKLTLEIGFFCSSISLWILFFLYAKYPEELKFIIQLSLLPYMLPF